MKKINNDGLTLVELILTMAISVIVIGGVTMLMSLCTGRYQSEERNISLQMESEAILNQLNNLIMEGNNVTFDGSRLTIYHTDEDASTYDKTEVIWLNDTDHCLYLYYIKNSADLADMNNEISSGANLSDNLFGEYVDSLSVNPTSLTFDRSCLSSGSVTLTLGMKLYDKTYQLSQMIKLRNRIVNLPTSIPTPP